MFWRHLSGWRFSVDEGGGAAAGSAEASPSGGDGSAPAAPAVASSPAPTSSADPGSAAPAPAQAQPGFRDLMRQYGYDTSAYQNDQAAAASMALQLRQAQEMQERLRPHWTEFQQYVAQRQQQAAQPAPKKPWFEAPEFDPKWTEAIGYDAEGRPYVQQGYPTDTLKKAKAWADHFNTFTRNLATDPIGTLRPGLEEVVQEVAGRIVQQQLGQYQEQMRAQQILHSNSPWMYQVDPQTKQPALDPATGRPQFSEWGNRYRQYVAEAVQLGLQDSMSQHRYAERSVMAEMAMSRLNGQGAAAQAQAQGDAAKNQFIQQSQRQPNVSGADPANGGKQPRRNLRAQLAADIQAAGHNLSDRVN